MSLKESRLDTFGPVLPDGTPFRELIDLERREVSLRLLADRDVFELEMDRVFARQWIVVAHESEIPNTGDFVLRSIAMDPVIVIRRSDGDIDVLLNVCSHRGMQVCRAECGNAEQFQCAYHGWTFGSNGSFVGAPFERAMYGDVLQKDLLGLERAQVGLRAGIVFANWDPDAPSLDEFLGDIGWYIDAMLDRSDSGLEVVGPPQRFVVHANWKVAGEQFSGDGYHAQGLHRSLGELSMRAVGAKTDPGSALRGIDVSTPQGHGLRCTDRRSRTWEPVDGREPTAIEKLLQEPPPGLPKELAPQLVGHLDDGQLQLMADTPAVVAGLFPSALILAFPSPDPRGGVTPILGMHIVVPKGPDLFEFVHWNFVERDASAEFKRNINRVATFNTGSSGIIEQDDAEAWPSIQESARGIMGRRHSMKYQALLGVQRPNSWPGGGLVYEGMTKDDNQWNWWTRYGQVMSGRTL